MDKQWLSGITKLVIKNLRKDFVLKRVLFYPIIDENSRDNYCQKNESKIEIPICNVQGKWPRSADAEKAIYFLLRRRLPLGTDSTRQLSP